MRRFSRGTTAIKEAATWLARLRADDRSPEDERAFRAWLGADPRNAAAFEAVNATWESVGALSRDLRDGRVHLNTDVNRRALLAGSIGLAVAGGGAFAFLQSAAAEVYQTGVGEQKHVTLKDGTRVFLDTNTRLAVDFNADSRLVKLRYGRANFRVATDARGRFAVKAAQKRIVDRGARSVFDVRCDGDQLSVLLIQGGVMVESQDGEGGQVLSVGERLVATSQGTIKLDNPDLLPLLAWHTGQAIFESATLGAAVEEMNRYSMVKLEVDDQRLARMKVSGVYRVGDSAAFARSLARLLPIALRFTGNRIDLIGDEGRMVRG